MTRVVISARSIALPSSRKRHASSRLTTVDKIPMSRCIDVVTESVRSIRSLRRRQLPALATTSRWRALRHSQAEFGSDGRAVRKFSLAADTVLMSDDGLATSAMRKVMTSSSPALGYRS